MPTTFILAHQNSAEGRAKDTGGTVSLGNMSKGPQQYMGRRDFYATSLCLQTS